MSLPNHLARCVRPGRPPAGLPARLAHTRNPPPATAPPPPCPAGIGLCALSVPLDRLPGWDQCSYGYHGGWLATASYSRGGGGRGVARGGGWG